MGKVFHLMLSDEEGGAFKALGHFLDAAGDAIKPDVNGSPSHRAGVALLRYLNTLGKPEDLNTSENLTEFLTKPVQDEPPALSPESQETH